MMKRLFWLSVLSLALFLSMPTTSKAFWNTPQNNHGFGWWQGCALRWGAFLHFEGPLYSYGPYCGQGYAYMYYPGAYFGSYNPAYPAAYYGYPTPYSTVNGFNSWNGTGVQLGYPTALTVSPSDYFSTAVLQTPPPPPVSSTSNYYGGAAVPGYFTQPPPSRIR